MQFQSLKTPGEVLQAAADGPRVVYVEPMTPDAERSAKVIEIRDVGVMVFHLKAGLEELISAGTFREEWAELCRTGRVLTLRGDVS